MTHFEQASQNLVCNQPIVVVKVREKCADSRNWYHHTEACKYPHVVDHDESPRQVEVDDNCLQAHNRKLHSHSWEKQDAAKKVDEPGTD